MISFTLMSRCAVQWLHTKRDISYITLIPVFVWVKTVLLQVLIIFVGFKYTRYVRYINRPRLFFNLLSHYLHLILLSFYRSIPLTTFPLNCITFGFSWPRKRRSDAVIKELLDHTTVTSIPASLHPQITADQPHLLQLIHSSAVT